LAAVLTTAGLTAVALLGAAPASAALVPAAKPDRPGGEVAGPELTPGDGAFLEGTVALVAEPVVQGGQLPVALRHG
jgi:hypothetical protein